MRPHALALGVLLGTTMAMPAVLAQSVPPLVFAQPLSPAATQSIQTRLKDLGVYTGRLDGIWGPDSQIALQNFQQTHGLQSTGGLNQATLNSLGLRVGDLFPSATPVAAMAPVSPTLVRTVQSRLQQLGFYAGAVDGLWGAGTQDAIAKFQQGRGLQANGQINPITLTTLGIDATTGAVVQP
jgi:peptidoglycan hydrolase-like protein with peptidoglycan-binding domain